MKKKSPCFSNANDFYTRWPCHEPLFKGLWRDEPFISKLHLMKSSEILKNKSKLPRKTKIICTIGIFNKGMNDK